MSHRVGQLAPADSTVMLQDSDDSTVDARQPPWFDRPYPHTAAVLAVDQRSHQVQDATMTSPVIRTVGVPKEIKNNEYRVAMTPDGVREFERHGINVFVETGAGVGASFSDADYRAAGAEIVPTAADAWAQQMVVKVKEPQGGGVRVPARRPHAVHLPPPRRLPGRRQGADRLAVHRRWPTRRCSSTRGALPLLAPMSEVAGRLAPQIGAHYLERHNGGRGVLMGGAPGVRPGQGRGARRRQRRVERGVDRRRHGGRGRAARQEPRPPALGRPDPQGPHHDAGVEPWRGRAQRRRRRPRDRRRARRRRTRAGRRHRGHGAHDEARRGDRRRRRSTRAAASRPSTRPPTTSPSTSCTACCTTRVGNMPGAVPHTSTYALTNATLPYQLEVADPRRRRWLPARPRAVARPQHLRRPGHQRSGRRVPRHAVHRAARCAELTRADRSVPAWQRLPQSSTCRRSRRPTRPSTSGSRGEWRSIADQWLVRNMFGYAVLHYDDVTAILRDKRWHSAVSRIPELMGITNPDVPRAPAGQHPVGRGRRAHAAAPPGRARRSRREPPIGCGRSCAR